MSAIGALSPFMRSASSDRVIIDRPGSAYPGFPGPGRGAGIAYHVCAETSLMTLTDTISQLLRPGTRSRTSRTLSGTAGCSPACVTLPGASRRRVPARPRSRRRGSWCGVFAGCRRLSRRQPPEKPKSLVGHAVFVENHLHCLAEVGDRFLGCGTVAVGAAGRAEPDVRAADAIFVLLGVRTCTVAASSNVSVPSC